VLVEAAAVALARGRLLSPPVTDSADSRSASPPPPPSALPAHPLTTWVGCDADEATWPPPAPLRQTVAERQGIVVSSHAVFINQSINQGCNFRVVQVIKSLQDPLEAGNNLAGISDNVRERGLEQKCF